MEKLRKFNLEDDYLEIKESLEYPTLSLTDDNGKVWVKEKPISYIVAKYYINEEDVNKGYYIDLFGHSYYDIYYIIDHYIVDDNIRIDRDENNDIAFCYNFETVGEHTVTLYIKDDISDVMYEQNDDMVEEYVGLYLSSAFSECKNLTSIDFSHFLESYHVNSMESMFYNCQGLTSVTFGDNFDTSNVTDMTSMFNRCSSLTSLNLTHFDTSNVTDFGGMFNFCSSLTSLNLTSFDTSKATNMGYMFKDCESLTSLDLTNFDTSNVTTMPFMFSSCWNLTSLNLSGWDISKVENGQCAFNSVNDDVVIGVDTTLDIFRCMPL